MAERIRPNGPAGKRKQIQRAAKTLRQTKQQLDTMERQLGNMPDANQGNATRQIDAIKTGLGQVIANQQRIIVILELIGREVFDEDS